MILIAIPIMVAVTLPFHFLLRIVGRKGFVRHHDNGRLSYIVDCDGLKKACAP